MKFLPFFSSSLLILILCHSISVWCVHLDDGSLPLCQGPSQTDSGGIECWTESNEKCSNVFKAGTEITFRCDPFFTPSSTETPSDYLKYSYSTKEDVELELELELEINGNDGEDWSVFDRDVEIENITTEISKEVDDEWFFATCLENGTWSQSRFKITFQNGTQQPFFKFSSFRCKRDPFEHCGQKWSTLTSFINLHLFNFSVFVHVLGIVANLSRVFVLARKHMRKIPFYTILAALSFADFCFVLNILVTQSLQIYRSSYGDERSSFARQIEYIIATFLRMFLHMRSVYLTVLIGFWHLSTQFKQIAQLDKDSKKNVMTRTRWLIFWIVFIPNLPLFIYLCAHRIQRVGYESSALQSLESSFENENITSNLNLTIGSASNSTAEFYSELGSPVYEIWRPFENYTDFIFLLQTFLEKIIPCVLIAFVLIFEFLLILQKKKTIHKIEIEYADMKNSISSSSWSSEAYKQINLMSKVKDKRGWINSGKKINQVDKQTTILLMILLIFLLMELPKGVYAILFNFGGDVLAKECLVSISNFVTFLESFRCLVNVLPMFL